MKNSYIRIQVEGKNVSNYLKWLIKKKIPITEVNLINHNKLELTTYNSNYKELSEYSKTYKIQIIKKYGLLKLLDNIKINKFIIISILISIVFLNFLSNIIFDIEVVYNDQEIVKKIENELKKYQIEKYKLKKDYNYLNEVKEQILNDNKESLEWIEIIESGTKYIVKLVERKKENKKNEYEFQKKITNTNGNKRTISSFIPERTIKS